MFSGTRASCVWHQRQPRAQAIYEVFLAASTIVLLGLLAIVTEPGTVSFSTVSRSVRHRRALDVLEMREIQAPVFYSDDRALKASLAARPGKVTVFQAGGAVA